MSRDNHPTEHLPPNSLLNSRPISKALLEILMNALMALEIVSTPSILSSLLGQG